MARGSKPTKPRANTPIDKEIGLRIRALRIDADMSQDVLAHSLGVSFQQIQKYEKGVNRIAVSRLIEVARALKTTPLSLIPWDQSAKSVTVFDDNAYKLAKTFMRLKDNMRKPIRMLIESIIANGD